MLANFTEQGIRSVKDTVKRAEAFKETAKAAGVTIKEVYWTLGQYDVIVTVEAKDETAVTALGLTLAKAGNLSTQTLRAFGPSEMTEILGKVK
jgi:uncharacterized protein with GYD domain